jgi:hypothetical protein
MTELRRFGLLDFLLLLAILAGAAGIRSWYLLNYAGNGTKDGPYQVQDDRHAEWQELIHHWSEGQGFVGPAPLGVGPEKTAYTAPLYPLFLAALEGRLGDPSAAQQISRWIQVGLGGLTAAFYFLFARRAFRSTLVGLLAGAFSAVHPFWILNCAELNDGAWATFLLAVCLYLGARGSGGGAALTSLLFGVSLAALALVRAALLPFAFVALLGFLARCRVVHRGWLYALLAVLGFGNSLLPWILRNFQAYHEVIPVVDSTYYHLWEGNNTRATGGPLSSSEIEQELGQPRLEQLQRLEEPARYRALAPDYLESVRSHPTETFKNRLRAALGFLFGADWFEGQTLWREQDVASAELPAELADLVPAALTGSLLFMLGLGFLGWRWAYGWRHESLPASLAMIWIPLPYILSHAEHLSGPRLPLDGVLICYSAFVVACVIPPIGRALLYRDEMDRPG